MLSRLHLTKSKFETDREFECRDGAEEFIDLLHGTDWEILFDSTDWDECVNGDRNPRISEG